MHLVFWLMMSLLWLCQPAAAAPDPGFIDAAKRWAAHAHKSVSQIMADIAQDIVSKRSALTYSSSSSSSLSSSSEEGLSIVSSQSGIVKSAPIDLLEMYADYAMAGYSVSVHDHQVWNCTKCTTRKTRGTKIHATFGTDGKYHAYGYIAVNRKAKSIITVFRGSSSNQDFLADMDVFLTKVDLPMISYTRQRRLRLTEKLYILPSRLEMPLDIKVHSGFQRYYLTSRQVVQSALHFLARKHKNYKVVFTGHSLGGALATLAAADFADINGMNYTPRIQLVTYGQPRTGNLAWANWIDSLGFGLIARVTRQRDIVPHLPPLEFGYIHTSQEHGLDLEGSPIACTNIGRGGETKDCQNSNFWWPHTDAHIYGYFNRQPCFE